MPPLGCINLHASLLPKSRGAAPIRRALTNGDLETGVCVQKMVYQLDAGDVIDEVKMAISEDRTFGELEEALCNLSKDLLISTLHKYEHGIPAGTPQDISRVTFAAKIRSEEAEVHWNTDARFLHNLIRGHSPKPGAWCMVQVGEEKKRLKILQTKLLSQKGEPGHVLLSSNRDCIIAALNGSLQLLQVQPEGKKPMSASDWLRGLPLLPKFC